MCVLLHVIMCLLIHGFARWASLECEYFQWIFWRQKAKIFKPLFNTNVLKRYMLVFLALPGYRFSCITSLIYTHLHISSRPMMLSSGTQFCEICVRCLIFKPQPRLEIIPLHYFLWTDILLKGRRYTRGRERERERLWDSITFNYVCTTPSILIG